MFVHEWGKSLPRWGGAPNHNILQLVHMASQTFRTPVFGWTLQEEALRSETPPLLCLPTYMYTCVGRCWRCSLDKMNLDILERNVDRVLTLLQKLTFFVLSPRVLYICRDLTAHDAPSPSIFGYCKRSKIGWWEGLRGRRQSMIKMTIRFLSQLCVCLILHCRIWESARGK